MVYIKTNNQIRECHSVTEANRISEALTKLGIKNKVRALRGQL